MQSPPRLRCRLTDPWPDQGTQEGAIESLVDLGHARDDREYLLVLARLIERTDVVQTAPLKTHEIATGNQLTAGGAGNLVLDYHLPEAGREQLDDVQPLHDLRVLALRDFARDEDAEVADVVMQEVDDRLVPGDDLPIVRRAVEDARQ